MTPPPKKGKKKFIVENLTMPVATLDSIKKKQEEEQTDGGNEYYSGGAGAQGGSGLNVVAPGDRRPGGDPVASIFNRATEESQRGQGVDSDLPIVTVTFYSNGFTLDDGPLREAGVPENDTFLKEISQGYCPQELVVDGKPSQVKINDKRGEQYVPPAYVAFSGGGQSAGASSSASSDSVIQPGSGGTELVVDGAQPTIRVQIVFASNRKREVIKFNKTHTVQDLIGVINGFPHVSGQYQMLLGQPPKPVPNSEFGKTLVEAGIAGASVTVKQV